MRRLCLVAILVFVIGGCGMSSDGVVNAEMKWRAAELDDQWVVSEQLQKVVETDKIVYRTDKRGRVTSPNLEIPIGSHTVLRVTASSQSDAPMTARFITSIGTYTADFRIGPGETLGEYNITPFIGGSGFLERVELDFPPYHPAAVGIHEISVLDVDEGGSLQNGTPYVSIRGLDGDIATGACTTSLHSLILLEGKPFPAASNRWVIITIKSDRTGWARLLWRSSELGITGRLFPVLGDGKWHTYNLDMSQNVGVRQYGWTGTIEALGLNPLIQTGATVSVESIAYGSTAVGDPDVGIYHVGTRPVIVRPGDDFELELDIRNTGGRSATGYTVQIVAPTGITVERDSWSVASIAPDRQNTLAVLAEALSPGTYDLFFNLLNHCGDTVDTTEYQLAVVSADALVPTSKTTGDIPVGVFYFPGWQNPIDWRPVELFRREPILGYYRQSDVEIADWHLTWAEAFGIDFFMYCWYWEAGQMKLYDALHEGYLQSEKRKDVKFAIMWANHNAPGTSSYADFLAAGEYWIDNYFQRSEYMTIDGKPIVMVFQPKRLRDDMGITNVRRAITDLRKKAQAAGLPDLLIVGRMEFPDPQEANYLSFEGYDAISAYTYHWSGIDGEDPLISSYAEMVDGTLQIYERKAKYSIPYIPVTTPGWDPRPWHGEVSPMIMNSEPREFKRLLLGAQELIQRGDNVLPLVFVEAWNEWGEGSIVEPDIRLGFEYLQIIREVFGDGRLPEGSIPYPRR